MRTSIGTVPCWDEGRQSRGEFGREDERVVVLMPGSSFAVHCPWSRYHSFKQCSSFLTTSPSAALLNVILNQSRDPSQGAGKDAAQEPSFNRSRVARHWRPAKPRVAALRRPPVRLPLRWWSLCSLFEHFITISDETSHRFFFIALTGRSPTFSCSADPWEPTRNRAAWIPSWSARPAKSTRTSLGFERTSDPPPFPPAGLPYLVARRSGLMQLVGKGLRSISVGAGRLALSLRMLFFRKCIT
jgi:hypothetical protein